MANPVNMQAVYNQGRQNIDPMDPNGLYAGIPGGAVLAPGEQTKATKAAQEKEILKQWMEKQDNLAAARKAETGRIAAEGKNIYAGVGSGAGMAYPGDNTEFAPSLQQTANQSFPDVANGVPMDAMGNPQNPMSKFYSPNGMQGQLNAGVAKHAGTGGVPQDTPVAAQGGRPTSPAARGRGTAPTAQQDPFMGGPANAGAMPQQEMAALFEQARLAKEAQQAAAYKDRLNAFGAGSGYEELQRPRKR